MDLHFCFLLCFFFVRSLYFENGNVFINRRLSCALVVHVVHFSTNLILPLFCHPRVYGIGEKELILLPLTRKMDV
jgi:hypothetical protein